MLKPPPREPPPPPKPRASLVDASTESNMTALKLTAKVFITGLFTA